MVKTVARHLLLAIALCFQIGIASAQSSLLFVIADTGKCKDPEGTSRVAGAIRKQPDVSRGILVEVGDLAYPTATRENLLACHEPFWGGFKQRLAVPGNHEWSDPRAAGFFSLFPEPVPRKVPLNGPWHLLLLDSNLRRDAWDAQLKWLDQTLLKSQGECLIAAWHHPRWSSGKHGDNVFTKPLWDRLQGKASFTLHGHDHHFEALPALDGEGNLSPSGVPSFIVGNGGATLYSPGKLQRSDRSLFGQWGFLRMELEGMEYRWQAFGDDGKIKDSGRGTCRR